MRQKQKGTVDGLMRKMRIKKWVSNFFSRHCATICSVPIFILIAVSHDVFGCVVQP